MTLSTVTQPSGHWPVLSLVRSSPDSSGACLGRRLGGYAYANPTYDPDWGIARQSDDAEVVVHLVRATKGSTDLDRLQFPHEKRKVLCAQKVFHALEVRDRHCAGNTRGGGGTSMRSASKPTRAWR